MRARPSVSWSTLRANGCTKTHRGDSDRVVVISVDGEDRETDVDIVVLVVDHGEPAEVESREDQGKLTCKLKSFLATHCQLPTFPSSGSLRSSMRTGLSPWVNSRRSFIVSVKV